MAPKQAQLVTLQAHFGPPEKVVQSTCLFSEERFGLEIRRIKHKCVHRREQSFHSYYIGMMTDKLKLVSYRVAVLQAYTRLLGSFFSYKHKRIT